MPHYWVTLQHQIPPGGGTDLPSRYSNISACNINYVPCFLVDLKFDIDMTWWWKKSVVLFGSEALAKQVRF